MLFTRDLLSDLKPALAEQIALPRKILAPRDDPLGEKYEKRKKYGRTRQRGVTSDLGTLGSSPVLRVAQQPGWSPACSALKRRLDIELPARLCSLRYLPFKIRGLNSFSDYGRLLA